MSPECAHIIPFAIPEGVSLTDHHDVSARGPLQKRASAIETFTGHGLTADLISSAINSPRNTLNLETNLHFFMDKYMAWGIEAKFVDQKVGLKSRAYSGIVLILAIQ